MKFSTFWTFIFGFTTACLPSLAGAHDYWIQASPANTQAPQNIAISLHVGTDLVGDSRANIPDWYEDFSFIHAGRRASVPGGMGDDPAGQITAEQPGVYLVGYQNKPENIELPAAKFHAYLKEEGLERIISEREQLGQAKAIGREYYQRCAKSLIRVGEQAPKLATLQQAFHYRLEIIPQGNPYRDQQLPVQLLFDGKPQADLLVIAFNRTNPQQRQLQRTDAQGMANITLAQTGDWIIKTVHMQPYEADDSADWISFWASLTFTR